MHKSCHKYINYIGLAVAAKYNKKVRMNLNKRPPWNELMKLILSRLTKFFSQKIKYYYTL